MPKNRILTAQSSNLLARDFKKGSFLKLPFLNDSTLNNIKERCLQLLFPRVCPICGEILKLPKKWYQMLTIDSALPINERSASTLGSISASFENTLSSPNHEDKTSQPDSIMTLRTITVCPDCYPKLSSVPEPTCARCSRPLSFSDDHLCDICKRESRAFDSGTALWLHDDISRKVIYDLKFNNKRDNAELIGFEMALHAKDDLDLWKAEVLLPVPLHKKRFIERGFNQAELIAEKLSFWLEKLYGIQIPVDSNYLLRTEPTRPQRTLKSSQRSQNVRSAFTVCKKPPYHSVILIDDIFTSGSTINACAATLKRSGTERVHFLTASIV